MLLSDEPYAAVRKVSEERESEEEFQNETDRKGKTTVSIYRYVGELYKVQNTRLSTLLNLATTLQYCRFQEAQIQDRVVDKKQRL